MGKRRVRRSKAERTGPEASGLLATGPAALNGVPRVDAQASAVPPQPLTRVMSLEAAAALMCRLGCRTELLQSRARAKVPTDLGRTTR